jgi:hypothetical protein
VRHSMSLHLSTLRQPRPLLLQISATIRALPSPSKTVYENVETCIGLVPILQRPQ